MANDRRSTFVTSRALDDTHLYVGAGTDTPAASAFRRPRTARRLAAFVSVGVLALSLTACSTDETPAGTDTEDALVSPLMEAISLAGKEYQEFESSFLANHEDQLTTCMTDAGFEYYKATPLQVNNISSKDSSLALAKENGYGISGDTEGVSFAEDDPMTRLFYYAINTEQSAANQTAYDNALAKNDEYIASLSEDELAAYELARYGEAEGDDYEVDEDGNLIASDNIDPEHMGCETALADAFVDPAQEILDSEEHVDTVDSILSFYEQVDSDEAIADVYEKWATCFTQATGEQVVAPSDVTDALYEELDALFAVEEGLDTEDDEAALDEYLLEQEENGYDIEGSSYSTTDQSYTVQTIATSSEADADSADSEVEVGDAELELTDEELADLGIELDDTSDQDLSAEYGIDQDQYNALVEREKTLAQADVNCRFETDYFDSIQRAQIELENKFVKDNKDKLDALATAIREARAAA